MGYSQNQLDMRALREQEKERDMALRRETQCVICGDGYPKLMKYAHSLAQDNDGQKRWYCARRKCRKAREKLGRDPSLQEC